MQNGAFVHGIQTVVHLLPLPLAALACCLLVFFLRSYIAGILLQLRIVIIVVGDDLIVASYSV